MQYRLTVYGGGYIVAMLSAGDKATVGATKVLLAIYSLGSRSSFAGMYYDSG
jgi:hypothetical protein